MRNVSAEFVQPTSDTNIKFEENNRKIIFLNPERRMYKKVQVDGGAVKDTKCSKCDNLLVSDDEREERYVELKGSDVMHAIEQLEATILMLGECDENRHAYVVGTNVAPSYTTKIQQKALVFRKKYRSELLVREKRLDVKLY
ncbi:MAG: hypothetical protein MJZ28_01210 [Paludibacteraceae bacterium]|nr:hypothetical protein [Paludibacteraceae bacterium]